MAKAIAPVIALCRRFAARRWHLVLAGMATLVLALLVYSLANQTALYNAFSSSHWAQAVAAANRAPWLRLLQADAQRASYSQAQLLLEKGRPDEALPLLQALGDFKDSAVLALDIYYARAGAALAAGNAEDARALFEALGEHRDSAEQAKRLRAYEAALLLEKPLPRYRAFLALDGLMDSAEQAEAAGAELFEAAMETYRAGELEKAAAAFARMENFGDASAYIQLCGLWHSGLSAEEAQALLPKLKAAAETLEIGPVAQKKELLPWFLNGQWGTEEGQTASFDFEAYQRDFEGMALQGPYIYDDDMLRPLGHTGPLIRFAVHSYDVMVVSFINEDENQSLVFSR